MGKKGWLNQILEDATKEVQTWPKWMRASMETENEQVSAPDTVARVLTLKDNSATGVSNKKNT